MLWKLQALSGQIFAGMFRFACRHSGSVGLASYELCTGWPCPGGDPDRLARYRSYCMESFST